MQKIKPAEVSALLKKQLETADIQSSFDEVGTVLEVGDGIARVYGLTNAEYGELVSFDSGLQGMVLNLEEDHVGIVLFGPSKGVKEGDTVKRTNQIASIKVGEGILGRAVSDPPPFTFDFKETGRSFIPLATLSSFTTFADLSNSLE